MKKRRFLKIGLSLFVTYHLTAVLLMPNPGSILNRQVGSIFSGYASTLGLNTPWQFFSPEPSSHVYFEYEISPMAIDSDERVHRWPPVAHKDKYLADNFMRLLYHSRYVTSSPERIENFFVPWLCRHHPGTEEVTIRTLSEELVSLDKAKVIGGPLSKLYDVKLWSQITRDCESVSSEDASSELESSSAEEDL